MTAIVRLLRNAGARTSLPETETYPNPTLTLFWASDIRTLPHLHLTNRLHHELGRIKVGNSGSGWECLGLILILLGGIYCWEAHTVGRQIRSMDSRARASSGESLDVSDTFGLGLGLG